MTTRNLWLNLLAAAFAVGLSACAAQVTDGGESGGVTGTGEISTGGGPNKDPSATGEGSRENVRATTSALTEQVAEPHPDPWSPGNQGYDDPNEPHPDPWNNNPNPGDKK